MSCQSSGLQLQRLKMHQSTNSTLLQPPLDLGTQIFPLVGIFWWLGGSYWYFLTHFDFTCRNCYCHAVSQNSDIANISSDPDIPKESNNVAIRQRFDCTDKKNVPHFGLSDLLHVRQYLLLSGKILTKVPTNICHMGRQVNSFPTWLLSCCTDEHAHTYVVSTSHLLSKQWLYE